MDMRVEPLTDEAEWEQFVAATPGGTFYHTLKWKQVLEHALGLETEYLVVRDSQGQVAGICPFAVTQGGRLFRLLDSLPRSDYGGPVFRNEDVAEAAAALKNYLRRLAQQRGLTYAKMRCADPQVAERFRTSLAARLTGAGTMDLDLRARSTDHIWQKVFTQKSGQRTYIRRFEKDGFRNVLAQDPKDMKTFYGLYHSNMTHIGAPPRPLSYFQRLWELLYPDHFAIMLTVRGQECIGGQAFFIYPPKGAAYQTYVGLERDVGTQYRVYFYLAWGLLKWAEENGFGSVSLGGTPADPTSKNYREKAYFGATFNQDHIVYLPFNRKLFLLRESAFRMGRLVERWLPRTAQRRLSRIASGL